MITGAPVPARDVVAVLEGAVHVVVALLPVSDTVFHHAVVTVIPVAVETVDRVVKVALIPVVRPALLVVLGAKEAVIMVVVPVLVTVIRPVLMAVHRVVPRLHQVPVVVALAPVEEAVERVAVMSISLRYVLHFYLHW